MLMYYSSFLLFLHYSTRSERWRQSEAEKPHSTGKMACLWLKCDRYAGRNNPYSGNKNFDLCISWRLFSTFWVLSFNCVKRLHNYSISQRKTAVIYSTMKYGTSLQIQNLNKPMEGRERSVGNNTLNETVDPNRLGLLECTRRC